MLLDLPVEIFGKIVNCTYQDQISGTTYYADLKTLCSLLLTCKNVFTLMTGHRHLFQVNPFGARDALNTHFEEGTYPVGAQNFARDNLIDNQVYTDGTLVEGILKSNEAMTSSIKLEKLGFLGCAYITSLVLSLANVESLCFVGSCQTILHFPEVYLQNLASDTIDMMMWIKHLYVCGPNFPYWPDCWISVRHTKPVCCHVVYHLKEDMRSISSGIVEWKILALQHISVPLFLNQDAESALLQHSCLSHRTKLSIELSHVSHGIGILIIDEFNASRDDMISHVSLHCDSNPPLTLTGRQMLTYKPTPVFRPPFHYIHIDGRINFSRVNNLKIEIKWKKNQKGPVTVCLFNLHENLLRLGCQWGLVFAY